MIVTQEFIDALKEYRVLGVGWLELGDYVECLGYDVEGIDIELSCRAKAWHLFIPDYIVKEFINVG